MPNDTKATKRAPAKKTAPSAPAKKTAAKATPAKKAAPAKAAAPAARKPVLSAAQPAAPQAPAGWYVVEGGTPAYWDGTAWTDGPADQAAAIAAVTAGVAGEDTIDFMGRTIAITLPTTDQIAVWGRVARQASGLGNGTKAHDGVKLLGRLIGVVSSVLVNEADRDWLEDELIEKRMTMNDAGRLITQAIDYFAEKRKAGPAAAPTNGPVAKKARRR